MLTDELEAVDVETVLALAEQDGIITRDDLVAWIESWDPESELTSFAPDARC
jgi:hypothetical protein